MIDMETHFLSECWQPLDCLPDGLSLGAGGWVSGWGQSGAGHRLHRLAASWSRNASSGIWHCIPIRFRSFSRWLLWQSGGMDGPYRSICLQRIHR